MRLRRWGKRRTGGASQAVIMRHCGNGTNQRILPSRQLFFPGVWPTLLYERELRSTTEFPIRRIYPTTPIIITGWAGFRGLGFGCVLSTAVLKTGHVFGIPKKSGFVGDTLGMWAGGRLCIRNRCLGWLSPSQTRDSRFPRAARIRK